ncbi:MULTISPECIES: sigma-70 family RNA polymerase sigma factor [unclassified Nocardioides]|uniref:sigma-70 family RNA polymerase sigma factor n=1 Tax=unclassified Nocardioides TaxID=2615069 RepID=UPI0009EB075C|nr:MULTISPECIES: sigma-70 family RNA polymerase sigma factor [unclassified Nocardioides]
MTATSELRSSNRPAASQRRQSETNRLLTEARATSTPAERQRLLDEVVVTNLEVSRSIAHQYRNRGIPTDDLEQVAAMGLVKSANRYDPSKADDFLSYAVPTIRGEIRRHFRDLGWTIRPPRSIQELQTAMNTDASHQTHQGDDSDDAIATRLGVTTEKVREARAAQGCFNATSIDATQGADNEPLAARLVDDEFNEYASVEARVILHTLTKELSPRDRLILYLRFVEGRTQSEIGAEIGVTQMQVSRLLNRIITRMRNAAVGESEGLTVAS